MRRLVLPEGTSLDAAIPLDRELAHYLRDVLRAQVGDLFRVSDGAGRSVEARLASLERERARLEACGLVEQSAQPRPRITLLQGLAKGDKMDSVIRQASELGVWAIQPVETERSVAERLAKLERWRAIAEDAVRVSGSAWRPRIEAPRPLASRLADLGPGLVLAAQAPRPLSAWLADGRIADELSVLIGPEGGLAPAEVERAEAAGLVAVHLGPHTLRTETAGPAVLAVLMNAAGAWDRSA